MSLCNIPLLISSIEPLHRFVANLVWMFLWLTPIRFVYHQIANPIFNENIIGNFVHFSKS